MPTTPETIDAPPAQSGPPAVAVIGSFRQHYSLVLEAIAAFEKAGLTVTSPAGSSIVEPGVDFVRFETDDAASSDAAVQSETLRNIFAADLVYVVAPDGYVGRTTCYELGRLVQASRPVYLSDQPRDLPVDVPGRFIASPRELVERLQRREALGCWCDGEGEVARLERELASRHDR